MVAYSSLSRNETPGNFPLFHFIMLIDYDDQPFKRDFFSYLALGLFFKYLGLWWNIVNPRSASLFSSTLQDLPPQRKQYPEWAGTSHIKHSSKMFHRLAYKSFSHLKCALPRFVCICVKLTKTSQDIFQTPYYSLREDLEKTVRHATILIMLLK